MPVDFLPLRFCPERAVMSVDGLNLAVFGICYIVFLFSTVAHEAAHGLAAHLGGDPTAYEGGQVTLDPIRHIMRSPIGLVLIPILSFLQTGWMMGWASVPF